MTIKICVVFAKANAIAIERITMCGVDLKVLLSRLGAEDIAELKHSADAAESVEKRSMRSFNRLLAEYNEKTVARFGHFLNPEMPTLEYVSEREIELLLLENQYLAYKAGLATIRKKEANTVRLAEPGNLPRIPRKYSELMKWWDMTRKNRAPKKIQIQAKQIKRKYLDKCQQVYQKYSAAFRSGEVYNQKKVMADVKLAGETTFSRAKVIVTTETTRYYNDVRRNYYDQTETVTHYLYVAIRDHRTTEWCNDRNGLVYSKDDPLSEREKPPIHYNCRSEMLPLSPFNPKHKALINNKSLARRNNSPKPLMKGWNKR
jgi:SPP1 gp7 family putative phage head morphogenesis protein